MSDRSTKAAFNTQCRLSRSPSQFVDASSVRPNDFLGYCCELAPWRRTTALNIPVPAAAPAPGKTSRTPHGTLRSDTMASFVSMDTMGRLGTKLVNEIGDWLVRASSAACAVTAP